MQLNHTHEEAYMDFASGNQLAYSRSEDITKDILRGYQGYGSWVKRENRSWSAFVLLRLTVYFVVRVQWKQLMKHKKYMVFTGQHV